MVTPLTDRAKQTKCTIADAAANPRDGNGSIRKDRFDVPYQ